MTKKPAVMRFLLALAAFSLRGLRRLFKRWATPGSGPFLAGCCRGQTMLYRVIENFRAGDPGPVYRRFREKGRLAPDGLNYVASWVTQDLRRCFQIMESDDPSLQAQWMKCW